MQENSLNVKEQNIEHIISLCAKGRYGEAVELLTNSSFQDLYMFRNPITDALHEWELENQCIGDGADCCSDCWPCIGGCCCLPLCAFCCITPFISHDTFNDIAGSSVGCCEKIGEKGCDCCSTCL